MELRGDGQVAVIARAWIRYEAVGDFQLHYEVGRIDALRVREEEMQNRRGDVVGDISVDVKSRSGGGFGEIEFQDIRLDERDVGPILHAAAHLGCEVRIDFDGDEARGERGEKFRHFSVARADFEPHLIPADVERAGDALAPGGIGEEILAEASAGHGARV